MSCPVLRVTQIPICRLPPAALWSAVLQEPHISQPDSDDSVNTKKKTTKMNSTHGSGVNDILSLFSLRHPNESVG